MKVVHPFNPVYDKYSKILILGSIPSPKSREYGFYYMHPNNRFWLVLEKVFNYNIPKDIIYRQKFLIQKHIALWDVIYSCDIMGAADSTVKNVKPNNIAKIVKNSNIKYIFTTGKKAYNLYNKYCYLTTKIKAIYLPSTSPANCAIKFDKLVSEYQIIKNYLQK